MAGPRPKTMVMVDYEYLYFSCINFYGREPDLQLLMEMLKSKAAIVDMKFFGDFANRSNPLHQQLRNVRTVCSCTVETANPNTTYKKDYSDFIILDNIYQTFYTLALDERIHQCILLTGDGHFSSVVTFMRNRGLKVGIVGIPGTISMDLQNGADWVLEYTMLEVIKRERMLAILQNLYTIEQRGLRGSFKRTADVMGESLKIGSFEVEVLLKEMIATGILYFQKEQVGDYDVNVMKVDWNKAQGNRLYVKKDAPLKVAAPKEGTTA